jgi:hypothetical protein
MACAASGQAIGHSQPEAAKTPGDQIAHVAIDCDVTTAERDLEPRRVLHGNDQLTDMLRPRHGAKRVIEPVCAIPKRKLENGEQRLALQTGRSTLEVLKIADQRLWRTGLNRGNVGGSHTPGNNTAETTLAG